MGHLSSRYLSSDVLAKIEGVNLEDGLLRISEGDEVTHHERHLLEEGCYGVPEHLEQARHLLARDPALEEEAAEKVAGIIFGG